MSEQVEKKEVDPKKILSEAVDTILEVPKVLKVDIRPRNRFHALLQRLKIRPKHRLLTIYPVVAGSLLKISKLLLSMNFPMEALKNLALLHDKTYEAMAEHSETMARIIAFAVVNRKEDPPEKLVTFILNHFTSKDLGAAMSIVISQMGVLDFSTSIISARTTNLLKMSPNDQGS